MPLVRGRVPPSLMVWAMVTLGGTRRRIIPVLPGPDVVNRLLHVARQT